MNPTKTLHTPLGISPSTIIQRRNLPTRKRLSPVRGTFFRKKTRMLVESKSSGLRMACRSFHSKVKHLRYAPNGWARGSRERLERFSERLGVV